MTTPTLTIEELEKEFAAWRSNKKGRSTIPETLSHKVKILLMTHHRHSNVLRRLGISRQQAITKNLLPVSTKIEHHSKNPSPAFIKIPMMHTAINTDTSATTNLTLQRGDLRLLLNSPSNNLIQLIINALLR